MKRKRKIKPEDLLLDDDTILQLEKDLMMHEIEVDEDDEDFYPVSNDILDDVEDPDDDVIEKIPKPKIDKTTFYVIPKDFDDAIIKYYETGHLSDELAIMTDKIAQKLAFAPNFINYSYRNDMVGDAIIKMMKALIGKKYQHAKGRNPFSYFTRIAWNAFANRIKIEQRQKNIYDKYKDELLTFSENYNIIVKNRNVRIQSE